MKKIVLVLVSMCYFVSASNSYGSATSRRIQIFTTANGLPDNTINDIQKDPDGFLWIATNKGIARFDGKNFISFSKRNLAHFFKDDVVNEIKIDGNSIYLVSKKNGVKILDRKQLNLTDFSRKGIQSFYINGKHQLVLTTDGELLLYEDQKLKKTRSFRSYEPVGAILYQNSICILTQNKGVIQCQIENLKTNRIIPADFVYMYGKLIPSKKFGLVYATGNKVYVLHNNRFVFHPLLKDQLGITNYFENESATPYYISRSKNIFAFDGNSFVNHTIPSIKNPEVRKLFFVSKGCYFIATNQGLIRIAESKKYITTIDDNSLVEDGMIRIRRKIIPVNSQTTYFFGHPQIVVSTNGVLKNVPSENFSMYDSTLLNDKIFCTTDSYGVIAFDIHSKKIKKIQLTSIPDKEFFYVVEKVNTHEIFLGGTDKIVIYNTLTLQTKSIPLLGHIVHSIKQDGNLIWIGTDKGLRCAQYNASGFKWRSIPSFYSKTIRDIALDTVHKKIWLGTEEDGILIVDAVHFTYTQKKNHLLKSIATIINDQKGHIWASANCIAVFDLNSNKSYQLTQKNGLSNIDYNYKSAALLPNGMVIFGGVSGYDSIDYDQLKNTVNENYQIKITGVQKYSTIDQQEFEFENYKNQESIAFNTGKEELNLVVSDLDIRSPFSSYFTYQIDQEKTVPAYNSKIRISNLPYGEHELIINMYDNFGNLKTKKRLVINAIVPFYYHLSFYIVMSLGLLIFGSTTIYTIRKARKTEAIVKERIAMDLHDEVGTVLTRMLLITSSKKDIKQQHQELKQGISEALFSIRTSIHALSNTSRTLADLIDDTKEFLKKECSNSTIQYTIQHDKEIPVITLKPEVFRDCKLILFEATANALKYSEASWYTIHFSFGERFEIYISDDGILTQLEDIYNKGNGINNMIKRAQRNNGTCQFAINEPHGLQITLRFNWA
jgi:ligand-binding sensor domain-containing protein/two-component sensor histidine kinase